MAWDEGLAETLRADLPATGVTERRMFGGLCFLLDGHMHSGVHGTKLGGGAMFRVGPGGEAAALAIPGARPMVFTGRRMTGMIELSGEAVADDTRRRAMMALATAFVRSLPPK
jgi:hypothetical protein